MLQGVCLMRRCWRLQRQGRISFYGPSNGQEAATIVQRLAVKFLRLDLFGRCVKAAPRCFGGSLEAILAQLFGTTSSPAQGEAAKQRRRASRNAG